MKTIVWTPVAIESLQQTTDFLSKVWNDKIVEDFLSKLDNRISHIQAHPELAPAFRKSNVRRLLIHRTVSLFYRNYPDYIKLLLIWDNRQDSNELMGKITDAINFR